MAKDIEEKIGAMSQKNCHGLKYKYPLKNYRVHEMPTGDQLPLHYSTPCSNFRKYVFNTVLVTFTVQRDNWHQHFPSDIPTTVWLKPMSPSTHQETIPYDLFVFFTFSSHLRVSIQIGMWQEFSETGFLKSCFALDDHEFSESKSESNRSTNSALWTASPGIFAILPREQCVYIPAASVRLRT